ncbi:unnamed protein product [Moneuplotes crassus]|uniref:Uncharacterized protein n=1 Tax=Euplotes crassus TaxID=5936 RepID=A0AAD1Y3P9_EUPCR|nr:unnamed protein product [Moneuplotes crassus]
MKQSSFDLPTAPAMKPRKVDLAKIPENSNIAGFENCFDFLKDENLWKKYKSTNQIPCLFQSNDLLGDDGKSTSQITKPLQIESYSPIFCIEEDQEMEDKVSNSDEFMSEGSQESPEIGSHHPKAPSSRPNRFHSTKATPFFSMLSKKKIPQP